MPMALIIVDMLNDFIRPGGKLYFEGGEDTIAPVQKLRDAFTCNGLPIFYANDAHPRNSKEFESWPPHCVAGTPGAEVIDELKPNDGVHVIEKDDLSCFTNDTLERKLTALGVNELFICGVATEYCVLQAVFGARERGFAVTIVNEAIAGVDANPGDVDNALEKMALSGAQFVSLEEALAGLDA